MNNTDESRKVQSSKFPEVYHLTVATANSFLYFLFDFSVHFPDIKLLSAFISTLFCKSICQLIEIPSCQLEEVSFPPAPHHFGDPGTCAYE